MVASGRNRQIEVAPAFRSLSICLAFSQSAVCLRHFFFLICAKKNIFFVQSGMTFNTIAAFLPDEVYAL
jgi:hypothetical protein